MRHAPLLAALALLVLGGTAGAQADTSRQRPPVRPAAAVPAADSAGQADVEPVHVRLQGAARVDRLGPIARRTMLDTLEARRRVWEERRPRTYAIRVLSISDCVAVEHGPRAEGALLRPRLVVRDVSIVRRELAPVPDAYEQRCALAWRVDDLFADLARALAEASTHVARVEYDAAYGFPRAYWLERGRSRGAHVIVESFAPVP